MPNKDGKGPRGEGPKTGRQMGNCEGAEPCDKKGRSCSCGRGCRRRFSQND